MRNLLLMLLAGMLLMPRVVLAAPSIEELQKQIAEIAQQLEDLEDRVDKPERHAALDREWYGDFRTDVHSLHYQDVAWNPGVYVNLDQFGADVFSDPATWGYDVGADGMPMTADDGGLIAGSPLEGFATAFPLHAAKFFSGTAPSIGGLSMLGQDLGYVPPKSDINNDLFYTTRLRLGMRAKIADNMSFSGRLNMYKNWGDSVGTNVFDSWDAFSMDGTNGGSPSGDWLRVERAYFNWSHIADTPFYLSIGRRPSTYGSPTNYRENVKRGGTPSGHLVNFDFDGITIGYHAEELTGLEGSAIRFCYGQGFESEWGNGTLFNDNSELEDTHLGGFNIDVLNNDSWLIQLTAFRAMDVVDGFKGTFAFPTQFVNLFTKYISADVRAFPNMNFVTRYTPTTVIGDINLLGVNASYETMDGAVFFGSFGMTQLESNGKAGLFGGMGSDNLYEAQIVNVPVDTNGNGYVDTEMDVVMPVATNQVIDDSKQEGYGVYVGMQVPAPMGKFGLEYNYGSKYWTPFTQAQDDALGSKLATRGHVGEAYYIFEVNRNAFIKLGGIFYDYEYTGSGSPVGTPRKVDDVLNGTAFSMMPVVDTAWDAYASMTLKW
ncbi:DUF3373 family protein [Malonomonas rubra]|uniref:DUF3373 family protein n=1 Tax=Malonomonas rubra TaxID=57040 RepID=UPI0026EC2EE8|nr:DUF3373 family protein [Malonomonas rubra]